MTASRLDRLGELAGKATPGPWTVERDDSWHGQHVMAGAVMVADVPMFGPTCSADCDFIAAASPDVVAALVRVAIAVREREAAALAAANATISRVNVPEAHARFHASGKELAKALAALPPDSSEPVDGLDSEARAIARAAKQREDMNREA